jgi:hypothetical protein
VALSAAAFSLISASYFHFEAPFFLLFGGTLFLYSFHRYYKYHLLNLRTNQEKERWMLANPKTFNTIALFGFVLTIYEFIRLELYLSNMLVLGSLAVFISLFYVVRLGSKNLRELPFTKIIWVSFSYVVFTSILPHTSIDFAVIWTNSLFFSALLSFVFSMTLMFDLRDVYLDAIETKTIPQQIGKKRSILLSVLSFLYAIIVIGVELQGAELFLFLLVVPIGMLCFRSTYFKGENEINISIFYEGLILMVSIAFWFLN